MARELKGYARKRLQGLVPHQYDRNRMRGVQPPIREGEAAHHEREAFRRHYEAGRVRRPVLDGDGKWTIGA